MKLHRAVKTITAIALLVSIAGCATMFHGATQQVYIRSNMDDAKLYVNEAYIGTGNGVMVFHKNKNYTITARKAGYRDTTAIATKSFDAITLLGILIDWGIISILVIDGVATGAWQEFDQTSYVLDPQPMGETESSMPVSVQQEDKKSKAVRANPAQPVTNFNKK